MNTVLVECKREATTHMLIRFDAQKQRLRLEYGTVDPVLKCFTSVHRETLSFEEHGELRSLYGSLGWNWNEVWALVHNAEERPVEEPMRVWLETNAHRSQLPVISFMPAAI